VQFSQLGAEGARLEAEHGGRLIQSAIHGAVLRLRAVCERR
jgi:hypothetical protein